MIHLVHAARYKQMCKINLTFRQYIYRVSDLNVDAKLNIIIELSLFLIQNHWSHLHR